MVKKKVIKLTKGKRKVIAFLLEEYDIRTAEFAWRNYLRYVRKRDDGSSWT